MNAFNERSERLSFSTADAPPTTKLIGRARCRRVPSVIYSTPVRAAAQVLAPAGAGVSLRPHQLRRKASPRRSAAAPLRERRSHMSRDTVDDFSVFKEGDVFPILNKKIYHLSRKRDDYIVFLDD